MTSCCRALLRSEDAAYLMLRARCISLHRRYAGHRYSLRSSHSLISTTSCCDALTSRQGVKGNISGQTTLLISHIAAQITAWIANHFFPVPRVTCTVCAVERLTDELVYFCVIGFHAIIPTRSMPSARASSPKFPSSLRSRAPRRASW